MTAISSLSTASYSPLDLLKTELSKEVSSGQISANDQSAISSALDAIDSALTGNAGSASSRLPPDQMKSKIDSLIQNEVSSGKLTSDQATELKNVFANTFSGGPGGAGGAGAPPPPASSSSDNDADDSTSSTSSRSSDSTVDELLKKLVDVLKSSGSSSSSYGSDGSSTSSSSQTSLLVDYRS
jgi:hypothetical protein